jgi:hypothetical protein
MIGFVIRQMQFLQLQLLIDCLCQAGLSCQKVHGPDPAIGQTTGTISHFIMNVGCGKHGFGLVPEVLVPEPIFDSLLALPELLCYSLAHSKCLLAYCTLT